MRQSARFWDKIADRYSKRPIADEESYRTKLSITQEHLRPEMNVLELGCGTGTTALIHAAHVKHIRAIDISSKMIAIAQDKAQKQNIGNVTFERGTLEEIQIEDESFDAVLALNVLHLLDDVEAAIAAVRRILKSNGIFVSSTACIGDMNRVFRIILPMGRFTGLVPYVQVFSRRDLLDHVSRAGFRIEHEWQPGKRKGVFIVARKAD